MSKPARSKTEPIKRVINEGFDMTWALTPNKYDGKLSRGRSEGRTKLPKLKKVEI